MTLSFSDVEAALAGAHHIASDRRSAFASRLKNFQRMGFPPGINTGRGRAATYESHHLFLFGLVLELNQAGLSPERAKDVIEDDWFAVGQAASMAAQRYEESEISLPIFYYFDPSALSDLMKSNPTGDRASASFFYAGLGQLKENITDWSKGGMRRLTIINISAVLSSITVFAEFSETDARAFYRDIEAWGDSVAYPDRAEDEFKPEALKKPAPSGPPARSSGGSLFERMAQITVSSSDDSANDQAPGDATKRGNS